MRTWLPPMVLFSLVAFSQCVHAQGYPAEMVVTVAEVEVRSGPTKEYYATSKLKYGDRVLVRGESKMQAGWLAIAPPLGSFSWINAKSVKPTSDPRTGIVDAPDGVKLRPGSSVSNKPPDVDTVTIAHGSIVTILDKAKQAPDGTAWLPIQAWQTESRYIPGEAVQARQLANNNNTNINGAAAPARVASLSQNQWSPAQAPGNTALMTQGTPWAPGQTASFSPTAPAPQRVAYPPNWSQVGILRRSPVDKDGQPTYVLQDTKGGLLMYVNCAGHDPPRLCGPHHRGVWLDYLSER